MWVLGGGSTSSASLLAASDSLFPVTWASSRYGPVCGGEEVEGPGSSNLRDFTPAMLQIAMILTATFQNIFC